METERRRQILLAVLTVVLMMAVYRVWQTAPAPPPPSNRSGAAQPPARAAAPRSDPQAAPEAPDVHLDALNAERPKPVGNDRNLFRFKPKAPPPPPPQPAPVPMTPQEQTAPVTPPPPPPPPPIALKFIGLVQRHEAGALKIAVLADATGHVYHGVEGGTVAGQYRILKIGVESIEMAYLDGRGRQTIRLTGS
jgi:hypothetical protein